MTDIVQTSQSGPQRGKPYARIAVIAAAWFAAVFAAASLGLFDLTQSPVPLPVLVAIALPVGAFAATVALSPAARRFVLELDASLITEIQAWRIVGGMFLALYAFDLLPGLFAWPAGLGDVAVGVAAPFVAWSLRRSPAFVGSARFRLFHYLGLADFVVAVGSGIVASRVLPGVVEGATSAAMGQLPLVLIPAFAVPIFIILHIIALMQSAAARRQA